MYLTTNPRFISTITCRGSWHAPNCLVLYFTYCYLFSRSASFFVYPFHYDDVIMTMLASQITSLTVVYSIVYAGVNQRNIKAPRHWPLCGKFTGDRWISRTSGQLRGKCFHLMTSSCKWWEGITWRQWGVGVFMNVRLCLRWRAMADWHE